MEEVFANMVHAIKLENAFMGSFIVMLYNCKHVVLYIT